MHIDNWLHKNGIELSDYAFKVGISVNCLFNYRKGLRDIPLSIAVKMSKLTNGEVTLYDLAKLYKKK